MISDPVAAPSPRSRRHARLGSLADRRLAGLTTVAMGTGTVLALAGVGSRAVPLALAGGALAWIAIVLVMGHRWLDPMLVVALAVPLPAVWAAGDVRIAAVAPITAAVLAGWMIDGGPLARHFDWGSLPLRVLGLLTFVLALAAVASPFPLLALREFANLILLFGLLIAATGFFVERPRARGRVAALLALLSVGCGALAVLEAVGVLPGEFPRFGTPYNRAALGFGQPNGLGLFLALTMPLVAWRAGGAESGAQRWLWRVALGTTALGLLATFSRGSWAAVIAGAAALVLAREWRAALRIAGLALVSVLFLDVISGGMVQDTMARTIGDWVVEQRASLTLAGILMFLDHPLLGVGPGGFEMELDQYGILVPSLFDFQPTPHNAYVQMAAEAGAGGLLLYLGLLGGFLRRSARAIRVGDGAEAALQRALLWSLGVLVVEGFFVWPYAHGTGQAAILILALVASAPRLDAGSTRP